MLVCTEIASDEPETLRYLRSNFGECGSSPTNKRITESKSPFNRKVSHRLGYKIKSLNQDNERLIWSLVFSWIGDVNVINVLQRIMMRRPQTHTTASGSKHNHYGMNRITRNKDKRRVEYQYQYRLTRRE